MDFISLLNPIVKFLEISVDNWPLNKICSRLTANQQRTVVWEEFFIHYGFPERLHSDQGLDFYAGLIKYLCISWYMEVLRFTLLSFGKFSGWAPWGASVHQCCHLAFRNTMRKSATFILQLDVGGRAFFHTFPDARAHVVRLGEKLFQVDPMPSRFIMSCLEPLLPVLTDIMNLSLKSGVFIDDWPSLHHCWRRGKRSVTSRTTNYNPNWQSDVCEQHSLFPLFRSAYMKNRSTETALLRIQSDTS